MTASREIVGEHKRDRGIACAPPARRSRQHEIHLAARSCSPALRSNGDAFDPLGRVAPFSENPGIRTARRFLPCRETSRILGCGLFLPMVSAADYARDRLQISLRRELAGDPTQDVTQLFKTVSARGDLHKSAYGGIDVREVRQVVEGLRNGNE